MVQFGRWRLTRTVWRVSGDSLTPSMRKTRKGLVMHKGLTQLKEDYPVVYRNEDGSSYFWIDDLVKIKGVADNWSYNLMRQEFLRLSEYINNLEILLFML